MIGPLVYGGVAFVAPWLDMQPGDSVFLPIIAPRKVLHEYMQRWHDITGDYYHIAKRNEIGLSGYRIWKTEDLVRTPSSAKRYEQRQNLLSHSLGPQHNRLPSALQRTLLSLVRSAQQDSAAESGLRSLR